MEHTLKACEYVFFKAEKGNGEKERKKVGAILPPLFSSP
jgi:hypothetical protein